MGLCGKIIKRARVIIEPETFPTFFFYYLYYFYEIVVGQLLYRGICRFCFMNNNNVIMRFYHCIKLQYFSIISHAKRLCFQLTLLCLALIATHTLYLDCEKKVKDNDVKMASTIFVFFFFVLIKNSSLNFHSPPSYTHTLCDVSQFR